jgi:N-acetyl-anhydromuramyl-L-alanine amidase AmpD
MAFLSIFNKKIVFFSVLSIISIAIAAFLYFLNSKDNLTVIENFPKQDLKTEIAGAKNETKQSLGNEDIQSQTQNDPIVIEEKKELEPEKIDVQAKSSTESEKNNEEQNLQNELVSWGFVSDRSQKTDTIIVHSVYNSLGGDRYSLEKILEIFKDYGVSPHYIIDRDGKIHQLVLEKNTAYHAGESKVPDGRTGVNNFSIGIEVINAEDDEPEKKQYQSLEKLIGEIKARYKIKYILGHSDIASSRKTDPWNFDWKQLGGKKK